MRNISIPEEHELTLLLVKKEEEISVTTISMVPTREKPTDGCFGISTKGKFTKSVSWRGSPWWASLLCESPEGGVERKALWVV